MVKDCQVFEIKRFEDNRGFFSELHNQQKTNLSPKQINHSYSKKGVLRGIHAATFWKLVTCIKGKIIDVCVDLRTNSPTFMQYEMVELSENNKKQIFIPENCGHAFYALEDSIVIYSQGNVYDAKSELTYKYNDPNLNIPWPKHDHLIISERDAQASQFTYDNHIAHRFYDIK